MKSRAKLLVAAVMMAGAALASSAPANAGFGVSIGFDDPGWYGYYDDGRPCWWYRDYDLPAPDRCYDYFYSIWGPSIYTDGDFIFRDRDDWWRWHDRDDYRHWRAHDFHWRDRDWRGGHEGDRANWGGDRGDRHGHWHAQDYAHGGQANERAYGSSWRGEAFSRGQSVANAPPGQAFAHARSFNHGGNWHGGGQAFSHAQSFNHRGNRHGGGQAFAYGGGHGDWGGGHGGWSHGGAAGGHGSWGRQGGGRNHH